MDRYFYTKNRFHGNPYDPMGSEGRFPNPPPFFRRLEIPTPIAVNESVHVWVEAWQLAAGLSIRQRVCKGFGFSGGWGVRGSKFSSVLRRQQKTTVWVASRIYCVHPDFWGDDPI